MHFILLRQSNQIYNVCRLHNFLLYVDKTLLVTQEEAFPVPSKLVEDDARDDESNLFTLDHFLDDAEHWYLPLILCKVKPYTRVNRHPEHESSLHVNEIAEEIVLDDTARLLLARALPR